MTNKKPSCSPRKKNEEKNPKPTQDQHRAFDNGDSCLLDYSLLLRKTTPSQINLISLLKDVLMAVEVL